MNRHFAEEKAFLCALCSLPGLRYRHFVEMITLFGTPGGAWEAVCAGLAQKAAGTLKNEEWRAFARGIDPERNYEGIVSKGIGVKACGEAGYPALLNEINDPPPVIYHKGSLIDEAAQAVAIVGSRKATSYGIEVSGRLAQGFALKGVTVVSGAAYGIDCAGHRGALENGGYTIAVLGCGIDVIYPRANWRLFGELERKGCIISEYPPGTPPMKHRFPERNRIIAGLCRGVIVVEAANRSGALITADHSLSYGREVFAVPGSVFSVNSNGTNRLIKSGASLVTCAEDVCDELGIGSGELNGGQNELCANCGENQLDEVEISLIREIKNGLFDSDGFLARSNYSPGTVMSGLSRLEVKGLIKKGHDGCYYPRT